MRLWPLVATVCLCAAACNGNDEMEVDPGVPEGGEVADRDWPGVDFRCDEELEIDPADVIAVTGGTSFENEAHDCQQLVLPGGGGFGPLVGIFPLDDAMGDDFTGGTVATLYNFDAEGTADTGYAPLHISSQPQEQWACLVMNSFTDSATVGTARVFRITDERDTCASADGPSVGAELQVRISSHPGVSRMPPTARIRWDRGAQLHYVGFKCGTRWCSAYPAGANPSEPVEWAATSNEFEVIPGYMDEQNLAIQNAEGDLRPGPWGVITPSAVLNTTDTADLIGVGDIVVATITLLDDPTQFGDEWTNYAEKFQMQEDQGRWVTRVWLNRTSSTTTGGFGVSGPTPAAKTAEFVPMGHGAAGSVRWRWLDVDEGAWIYCVDGCCSVQGGA